MRYLPTLIKSAILNLLLIEDDLVPALWHGVSKQLKNEVPLSTIYEAIYRLRDEGLISYQSHPPLTNERMNEMLLELKGGSAAYNEEIERKGLVTLTRKGKIFSELLSLREMILPSRLRDAERHISSLQGALSKLSFSGA